MILLKGQILNCLSSAYISPLEYRYFAILHTSQGLMLVDLVLSLIIEKKSTIQWRSDIARLVANENVYDA